MIRNNERVENITDFVDSRVLKKFISEEEIKIIKEIRNKLIGRRLWWRSL